MCKRERRRVESEVPGRGRGANSGSGSAHLSWALICLPEDRPGMKGHPFKKCTPVCILMAPFFV